MYEGMFGRMIDTLYGMGVLKIGESSSPLSLDLIAGKRGIRLLSEEGFKRIAECFAEIIIQKELEFSLIVGISDAGKLIAEAIKSAFAPPQEFRVLEFFEEKQKIVFDMQPGIYVGRRVLLVGDFATPKTEKVVEAIKSQGFTVGDLLLFLDFQNGRRRKFKEAGYSFRSVFNAKAILDYLRVKAIIDDSQYWECFNALQDWTRIQYVY